MPWFGIVAVTVVLVSMIGLIMAYVGIIIDSDAVAFSGGVLLFSPVVAFIIMLAVLTLIHLVLGVDFGYPIN